MKHIRTAFLILALATVTLAQEPIKGSKESMEKLPTISAAQTQKCKSENNLPDPHCTPGVTDPNITQANISTNICSKNWHGVNPYTHKEETGTGTLRPQTNYTSKLKLLQMKEYGLTKKPGDYEEDHLISLQLGGNPVDPRNLWPEFPRSFNPKDGFEDYLHAMVCQGKMTLNEAQREISTDWVKFWTAAGKPTGGAAANKAKKVTTHSD